MKGRILIIDDQQLLQWSIKQKLDKWGYDTEVASTGQEGLNKINDHSFDLVLLDIKLPDANGIDILQTLKNNEPDMPVIIITAHGAYEDAIAAVRYKAFDFVPKPINFDHLELSINNAVESYHLKCEIKGIQEEKRKEFGFSTIVAQSQVMKDIITFGQKVSKSYVSTILLQGESGTGKDLIAKAIHYESPRGKKPFLAINCSALPETLIESELFGYSKGAFTDAKANKKGILELADGGTVFLDEISEMKIASQAKLLRVLEEQKFRPLGSIYEINIDILILAASNKNLKECVQNNTFREDLYYRLNVMVISLPPLREHPEDIMELSYHFITFYNNKLRKNIKGLTKESEKILLNYKWPGNVRELKNVIEHAMILEDADVITPEFIPVNINNLSSTGNFEAFLNDIQSSSLSLKEIEKEAVQYAIIKAKGNKSRAARLLKISRDMLRYKLKKHGLDTYL